MVIRPGILLSRRPAGGLGFGLLGLAALDGDGDVGHGGGVRGAVPVVLAGGDDGDVALGDLNYFVAGGDFADAFGDDEDLVAAVLVELVADAGAEMDDAEVEVVAVVGVQDGLAADGGR